MAESRVQKTLLNAKVNLLFYFLNLAVTFFSRKVFLDSLGADFFGLTSTIGGFIGFLSLVELGIGNAICVTLYKPLYEKDQSKLNEIISVLGFLYYVVGFVILGCGLVLAALFPFMFEGKGVSFLLVYSVFFTFLISVLLTYFVNFRQSILNADQRSYVINGCFQGSSIACYLLQMIVVYYTKNPYYWLLISLLTSIGGSVYLNVKINQIYPWLNASIKLGKAKWREYPDVIKKTKQLFLHKISDFLQLQIRPLIMFNFVSLDSIGKYDNYNLTAGKTSSLISYVLSGNAAGIGNLIAEGKSDRIKSVYWEFFALKFFIAGVMAFGFWHMTEPFLTCWLGEEYLLSKLLLIFIIIIEFIVQMKFATDMFIMGFGLFQDVWAPITQAIISVIVAIVGGYFMGLEGVLLGTIVSLVIIAGLWKPYFLFKEGLKESVWVYWKNFVKYLVCFVVSFVIGNFCADFVSLDPSESFLMWGLYALIVTLTFSMIYFIFLNLLNQGMRDLSNRVKMMLKSKFGSK